MRERMHHAKYALALPIVSEEMGHLRPDITRLYCLYQNDTRTGLQTTCLEFPCTCH